MNDTLSVYGGPLQAPGGLMVVIEPVAAEPDAKPQWRCRVLDDSGGLVATASVTVFPAAAYVQEAASADGLAPLLHYPGAQKHPASDQAALSWVNDQGLGLLRLIEPGKRLLVLPLTGFLRQSHDPIPRRTGQRGPSRSSDLWAVVAAWSLPAGFTTAELCDITGLSAVTVREALRRLKDLGLIADDPRRPGFLMPCLGHGDILRTFLIERWSEWRRGTGTPQLRPDLRGFVAHQDWPLLHKRLAAAGIAAWPTGATALEGGPLTSQRAWLIPSGLEPEVHLIIAASSLADFARSAAVNLSSDPRQGSSSLCVLAEDHPALRLIAHRTQRGFYQPAWPWGLAALDALEHRDARVRQAAEEALREWITNQDSEIERARP